MEFCKKTRFGQEVGNFFLRGEHPSQCCATPDVHRSCENNLLDTFTISKMWNFKTLKILEVCTFENSKFQNFKNVLPHINGL
jgi:hypothetical protein